MKKIKKYLVQYRQNKLRSSKQLDKSSTIFIKAKIKIKFAIKAKAKIKVKIRITLKKITFPKSI